MVKQITIPEINEDLAYLCGVLAGDGYVKIKYDGHKHYVINCGGNPENEVEFYKYVISPLFKELFDLDVVPKSLGRTYGVLVHSKLLVEFLLNEIGITESPKNDLRIPKIFYNNKNHLFNFIRGASDTDFSIFLRRGTYPVITGASKCREFMAEIAIILENEGFKVVRQFDYKVYDIRNKKGYFFTNRIHINGHKMLYKWLKLIGTYQPKNVERNKNNPHFYKHNFDLYPYDVSKINADNLSDSNPNPLHSSPRNQNKIFC